MMFHFLSVVGCFLIIVESTCTLLGGDCTTEACEHSSLECVNDVCECITGYADSESGLCARVECPALSNPANGAVAQPQFIYESTATYSCETGYEINGAATRTCQADQTWNGTEPTCDQIRCPGLTHPANGAVGHQLTFGSIATYSCNPGYEINGEATRTCQGVGTWNGTAATCSPISCPALSNPANGAVDDTQRAYESTATYSCDNGYALNGDATRTCQGDASWNGTAPTCDSTITGCPALSAPANGAVSYPQQTVGSTATYSCDNGYQLNGGATRTCQADGTWGGTAPTCAESSMSADWKPSLPVLVFAIVLQQL